MLRGVVGPMRLHKRRICACTISEIMRLHNFEMRLHNSKMRLHNFKMRLHNSKMRLHNSKMRLHNFGMRLHNFGMRLHIFLCRRICAGAFVPRIMLRGLPS